MTLDESIFRDFKINIREIKYLEVPMLNWKSRDVPTPSKIIITA